MCPACITGVAWIAAGAASTGGLAALVASKLGGRKGNEETDEHGDDQGDRNGNAECDFTREMAQGGKQGQCELTLFHSTGHGLATPPAAGRPATTCR